MAGPHQRPAAAKQPACREQMWLQFPHALCRVQHVLPHPSGSTRAVPGMSCCPAEAAWGHARGAQGDSRFLISFQDCFSCDGLMWTGKQSWSRNFSVQRGDRVEQVHLYLERQSSHPDSFIASWRRGINTSEVKLSWCIFRCPGWRSLVLCISLVIREHQPNRLSCGHLCLLSWSMQCWMAETLTSSAHCCPCPSSTKRYWNVVFMSCQTVLPLAILREQVPGGVVINLQFEFSICSALSCFFPRCEAKAGAWCPGAGGTWLQMHSFLHRQGYCSGTGRLKHGFYKPESGSWVWIKTIFLEPNVLFSCLSLWAQRKYSRSWVQPHRHRGKVGLWASREVPGGKWCRQWGTLAGQAPDRVRLLGAWRFFTFSRWCFHGSWISCTKSRAATVLCFSCLHRVAACYREIFDPLHQV